MGWLMALAVLVLLAWLPLGVSVKYDSGGPLLKLLAGPVKITLYPRPKKKPKPEKKAPEGPAEPEQPKQEEPKPPQPPKEEPPKPKQKGGSLLDFLPLVKTALDLLGDFRRKLRVNDLELKLILGGGDPCDLAVNYGRAWTAVGNLLPQLERLFVIKKRDIQVECDFTASETLVIARLDVTITLGRLLSLAVRYGVRALKEFLTIKKKRKGGAVT
ncbi:MAG: DUF2953 domain-containing protein [Faecousia sp.]